MLHTCSLLLAAGLLSPPDKDVPADAQPRLFTLRAKDISLNEALAAFATQTGNLVVDRRKDKANDKLSLDLHKATFWQALEMIACGLGAGVSLYEADGQVALVDRPLPSVPTCHSEFFRIAIKRVSVMRDEASRAHTCGVQMEIAWEPRLRVFYVQVGPKQGPIKARFAPHAKGQILDVKLSGRGPMWAVGKLANEDIVHLPAPPRASPRIDLLSGTVRAIGFMKMLTFVFDPLKTTKAEQEGVKVTLGRITKGLDHWTVEIEIENPSGGPWLDTHESWLDYNVISLERGEGTKKESLRVANEERSVRGSGRATIAYRFQTPSGRAPKEGPGWRMTYRTPARVVEVTAPFEFKRVPLP